MLPSRRGAEGGNVRTHQGSEDGGARSRRSRRTRPFGRSEGSRLSRFAAREVRLCDYTVRLDCGGRVHRGGRTARARVNAGRGVLLEGRLAMHASRGRRRRCADAAAHQAGHCKGRWPPSGISRGSQKYPCSRGSTIRGLHAPGYSGLDHRGLEPRGGGNGMGTRVNTHQECDAFVLVRVMLLTTYHNNQETAN